MKSQRLATLSCMLLAIVACSPAADDPSRAASSQVPTTTSVEADLEAIEAAAFDRFEAFQSAPTPAAQADAYVQGVAADAVWMPPDASLVSGRDAIRDWAEEYFSTWVLEVSASTDVKTVISGDLAVRRWVSMGTLNSRDGGDAVPFHMKSVEVFSRLSDGSWVLSIRMWNSNNDQPDI